MDDGLIFLLLLFEVIDLMMCIMFVFKNEGNLCLYKVVLNKEEVMSVFVSDDFVKDFKDLDIGND